MSESRRSKRGNLVSPWGDTKREVATADPVAWQDTRRPNLDDRRVDTSLAEFLKAQRVSNEMSGFNKIRKIADNLYN